MATASTYSIGCKLPNGLHLEIRKPLPGTGSKDERGPRFSFERFATLKGTNDDNAVGGFGITHGVDAALYDAWLEQHSWLPAVKNGLVFKVQDRNLVAPMAKEMAEVKSGLEPLDPEKPGYGVAPTDEQQKVNTKQQGRKRGAAIEED